MYQNKSRHALFHRFPSLFFIVKNYSNGLGESPFNVKEAQFDLQDVQHDLKNVKFPEFDVKASNLT